MERWWRFHETQAGELVVRPSPLQRAVTLLQAVLGTAFSVAVTALMFALTWFNPDVGSGAWIGTLMLFLLFASLGLWSIYTSCKMVFGTSEWIVAEDQFEIRTRFLRMRWVEARGSGSSIWILQEDGGKGGTVWTLSVGTRRNRAYLARECERQAIQAFFAGKQTEPTHLRELAERLAKRTGWRLRRAGA